MPRGTRRVYSPSDTTEEELQRLRREQWEMPLAPPATTAVGSKTRVRAGDCCWIIGWSSARRAYVPVPCEVEEVHPNGWLSLHNATMPGDDLMEYFLWRRERAWPASYFNWVHRMADRQTRLHKAREALQQHMHAASKALASIKRLEKQMTKMFRNPVPDSEKERK